MPESNRYKQKAEECRDQAQLALSEDEREWWLDVADEWEKIADKLHSIETEAQAGEKIKLSHPQELLVRSR
jgi:hypothetical protein